MDYLSESIAVIALLLSSYAIWQTKLFHKRQDSLGESQEKLNNLLSQQVLDEKESGEKADLVAYLKKEERNNYKLHIHNQGSATAKNVRFIYSEEDGIFIASDVASKFPLEILNKGQTVKLIAAITMESKSKLAVTLIWDDDARENYEEESIVTL